MEKSVLLKLARACIEEEFGADIDGTLFNQPFLKEDGATFVTITKNGHLRGCIGSLVATRSLGEDICKNAKAAAFSDPRFPPLSHDELAEIDIELSLLSPPYEIKFHSKDELQSKIIPKKHGVIIKKGFHQATFLPQVWEQLTDFDSFFSHLCQKAGLDKYCIDSDMKVFVYEVEKFKESV